MSVLGWKISFLNIFIVQVLGEVQESVKTGLWAGDCFIYTNAVNRLKEEAEGRLGQWQNCLLQRRLMPDEPNWQMGGEH